MGAHFVKITIFGSSSKGNCAFVEFDNGAKIYCDAGVALNKITTPKANATLLITHEHQDHCSQVKKWIQDYGARVICTKGTLGCLGVSKDNAVIPLLFDELTPSVALAMVKNADDGKRGTFNLIVLRTMHDAVEPCAFVVMAGKESFFYCTDTGEIPLTHRMIFDVALIEANYTKNRLAENLLAEDGRGYVSGRVSGGVGHLSLDQVYDWAKPNIKYRPLILLGHRSRMNFDEKEYEDFPDDFKEYCRLIQPNCTYVCDALQ